MFGVGVGGSCSPGGPGTAPTRRLLALRSLGIIIIIIIIIIMIVYIYIYIYTHTYVYT